MFAHGASDRQRLITTGLIAFVIVLAAVAAVLALSVLGRTNGPTGVAATPPVAAPSASTTPTASTAPRASAASPAPTASASIQPSSPESPAEATAEPTPTPVPGPAAVLALNSWVRSDVQLNMRRQPGLSADLRALLEPGQVVLTVEGPVPADGFDWYRVVLPLQTGGNGGGWIASGPEADPFASVIASDQVLRTCGRVGLDGVIAGLRFQWSLDQIETAIFNLLAATQGPACVTLERSGETIAVYVEASVTACGEPLWERGEVWILPSAAGDVVPDMQVKQRVRVSESLLTSKAVVGADGESNRHRVLGLAAEADPPFGCVHARVTETVSGRETYFMTDSAGCYLIEEATDEYALVRSDPDGTLFRLERRAGGGYHSIRVGAWSPLNVTALYSRYDGQFLSLYGQSGSCVR